MRKIITSCTVVIAVLAVLVVYPVAVVNASDSCWYEPGDPPVEHCDTNCTGTTWDLSVRVFDDNSQIARYREYCANSGVLKDCSRTAYCDPSSSTCEANTHPEIYSCD